MAKVQLAREAQKITKLVIDSLSPNGVDDYYVWDTELKGFGVRVWPTGRRVFVLQYRPQGARQSRYLTLGQYGALTADQARTLAKAKLGAVAGGADPARERQDAREAPTVRELGESYLDEVSAKKKPATTREYKRLWAKHVLPALGSTKARAVTSGDVAKLHRQMRKTPYAANRVLALLGTFFSFAAREGERARHDNPAHGVEPYSERARERFLTPAEFAQLGGALTRAEQKGLRAAPEHRRKPRSSATAKHRPKSADKPIPAHPFAVAAIRLLCLTGCREGEILGLRWEDVDLERGFLRLGDTKTGRSIRPLGAPAAEILASLPREDGSPYVLPGAKPGTHLAEIKRLWAAVRHASKLDGVRIHDLRHSFASVPAAGGESLLVIRSLLGHADVKTTQRYAHLGDDPVKASADRTATAIASWLGGADAAITAPSKSPAEVIINR
jgi:integrase